MPNLQIHQRSPYTIGADPELFLKDTSGKFISSVGKFGGTKLNPKPLGRTKGLFVQEDNVAVEFNIPPDNTLEKFRTNIQRALQLIEQRAKQFHLKIAIVASANFNDDQLTTPQAQRFGCNPDFNVWKLQVNPPPSMMKNKNLRSAGGHIHYAYKKDPIGLGRALDLFLGCPSIIFEADRERRSLYGKAGCVRMKPYGLEYRTLSNFWIKSSKLINMVFSQGIQAINFVDSGNTIPKVDAIKIIKCINNSDQKLLRELTSKYRLMY